jgi:hypothetical protein
LLEQLIGSYDGEIAWLDRELGRLFRQLPRNALVVIFSDHGEAFKEHGWIGHGASLYEEEVRVALLLRGPGLPEGRRCDDPVMLLDVAPTILGCCNVPSPSHYEGTDLAPGWCTDGLPQRPIFAETKAQYEGQVVKTATLGQWKLIRSVLDGGEELYRLPDERSNLAPRETTMRDALSTLVRRWVAEEDFWMLYAHGPGEFTATVAPRSGQFLNTMPIADDREKDSYRIDASARSFEWKCVPDQHTKGIFFQVTPADAGVRFDLRINGQHFPGQVFTGKSLAHPGAVPFDLTLRADELSDPVIQGPFRPDRPGFYVFHHRAGAAPSFPALLGTLDAKTIEQLRTLGYLR